MGSEYVKMIEINLSDNLEAIGWIIFAFVHVGFIFWLSWGISTYLKDNYDKLFYLAIGIILPAVILSFIWIGVLTGLEHIVWL